LFVGWLSAQRARGMLIAMHMQSIFFEKQTLIINTPTTPHKKQDRRVRRRVVAAQL
jgi:hypothetical protein